MHLTEAGLTAGETNLVWKEGNGWIPERCLCVKTDRQAGRESGSGRKEEERSL